MKDNWIGEFIAQNGAEKMVLINTLGEMGYGVNIIPKDGGKFHIIATETPAYERGQQENDSVF